MHMWKHGLQMETEVSDEQQKAYIEQCIKPRRVIRHKETQKVCLMWPALSAQMFIK